MTTEQTEPVAISCRGVRRTYGTGREAFEAVRGAHFDVPFGSITALLGTNGAGRTSTVELLEGLAKADDGEIRVLGLDPWRDRETVRRNTGVLLQASGFSGDLTVTETLRMQASLTSGARPIDEVLDDLDLLGKRTTRVGQLSGGEQRRLDIACALLGDPAVLFLDEPTNGLDVESRRRSHGRPGHLKRALAAGVRGFLPKTTEASRLAEVIRTVAGGGRYVDPELAAEAIGAGDSPLTPREADCLELAADGATIEDIATRAHLSSGTVRNYLSSAITKLGAANRHDACAIAARMGWI